MLTVIEKLNNNLRNIYKAKMDSTSGRDMQIHHYSAEFQLILSHLIYLEINGKITKIKAFECSKDNRY